MSQLNLVGQTFGNFEILSELGRGGMGIVYKAQQSNLNRIVAVKVLPPELSYDQNYIARFKQEAQNAARLEHQSIIPIYEIGEVNNLHYIAMRYIEGYTLKDLMKREGAMSLQRIADLLSPVAAALDYAHQRQVIHRDIKPTNIMIANDGTMYLADFGLARGIGDASGLTMTGMVMGTPEYMSPEQAQGLATIGTPTDIYALGIVIYQMLTGKLPFESETPMGMVAARITQQPLPPSHFRRDISPAMETVILGALANDPQKRYTSAGELLKAMRDVAGTSTPPAGLPASNVGATITVPTPVPPMSAPAQYIPTQVAPPPATPPPATPPPVTPPPSAAPTPTPEKKKGPGKGLVIGIGAGVLVILALCAVVGLFAFSPSDPPDDTRIAGNSSSSSGAQVDEVDEDDDDVEAASSDDIDVLLTDAEEALNRKGGLDDAIQAYEQVLTLEPDHVEAHNQLALLYNMRFQTDLAEEHARAAIELDPEPAFAYAMLADALNEDEATMDEAFDAANEAISYDDELSIGYAIRAEITAQRASDTSEVAMLTAKEDAEYAIELAEDEDNLMKALAHSAMGSIYSREYTITGDQNSIARGVEEFNKAIGLQDKIAYFYANLGYFYNSQGQYNLNNGQEDDAYGKFELAIQKFEEALDVDEQFTMAYDGIGWAYYYSEDYASALDAFDEALATNPDYANAYFGKSLCYSMQEPADYEQAIEMLNEAATIEPDNSVIHATLGWTYRAKSFAAEDVEFANADLTESENQFRRALEMNPENTDAMNGLGWVLNDWGRYGEAAEQFRASLALDEEQANIHNGLGWSLYNQELYGEAEGAFRRAVELNPDHAYAHDGLGWCLYYLYSTSEAYAEAEQHLRRSFELDPTYSRARLGLGYVLEEQGRVEEAVTAYQQVLELDPGNENAQGRLTALGY